MSSKLDDIKKILYKNKFNYVDNYLTDDQISIVYDVFCNDIIPLLPILEDDMGKITLFLGIYFNIKNNISESIKHYNIAMEKRNIYAIRNYAYLMVKEGNLKEAKKYYLMLIRIGDVDSMCSYANLIREENPVDAAIFYKMSAEKGNTIAMCSYARSIETKNLDEAKQWYLMASENGDTIAMNNYAYLMEKENPDEAKYWYKIASEKGKGKVGVAAMSNYISLLKKENTDKAKQLFMEAIKNGFKIPIKLYFICCKNNLEICIGLSKLLLDNPELNDVIAPELNNIKSRDNSYIIYLNKIKNSSKLGQCVICLEEESMLIPLECAGHYSCLNCYPQLLGVKCPYRCL